VGWLGHGFLKIQRGRIIRDPRTSPEGTEKSEVSEIAKSISPNFSMIHQGQKSGSEM
jgi:hypothetical protein